MLIPSDGGQRKSSKLQNSPGSFITFSQEVIGIGRKTTEIKLKFKLIQQQL